MDQKVSHVFGVPCEDETDKHNVKSYHLVNKLCLVGVWLREKEYGDCCRHGNEGFTAKKNPVKSLSESKTGYQMGNKWLNMICWIICDHKRRCHQLVLSGYKQPLKHPVPL